jgi:CheY-like chemotaxis protein
MRYIDGLQALTAMQEHEFDLVLIDAQMPNMDGLTATEKIRDLPGTKGQIPIIGLTANAMAADREALFEVGMDGYLPKPVRRESLQAAIIDAMQKSS